MTVYDAGSNATEALTAALKTLPDEWVICRDVRHSWNVLNDFHVVEQKTEGRRVTHLGRDLVCARCETVRHETYLLSRGGVEKIRQGYTYPGEYQIPGVPRGVKPSVIVQQEQYRRALERAAKTARKRA